ncbi:MAG: hypothetical protein Q8L68_07340 [Methylococcales bacterium]|nr:hypothetical protein [Methylococcales bacterium]
MPDNYSDELSADSLFEEALKASEAVFRIGLKNKENCNDPYKDDTRSGRVMDWKLHLNNPNEKTAERLSAHQIANWLYCVLLPIRFVKTKATDIDPKYSKKINERIGKWSNFLHQEENKAFIQQGIKDLHKAIDDEKGYYPRGVWPHLDMYREITNHQTTINFVDTARNVVDASLACLYWLDMPEAAQKVREEEIRPLIKLLFNAIEWILDNQIKAEINIEPGSYSVGGWHWDGKTNKGIDGVNANGDLYFTGSALRALCGFFESKTSLESLLKKYDAHNKYSELRDKVTKSKFSAILWLLSVRITNEPNNGNSIYSVAHQSALVLSVSRIINGFNENDDDLPGIAYLTKEILNQSNDFNLDMSSDEYKLLRLQDWLINQRIQHIDGLLKTILFSNSLVNVLVDNILVVPNIEAIPNVVHEDASGSALALQALLSAKETFGFNEIAIDSEYRPTPFQKDIDSGIATCLNMLREIRLGPSVYHRESSADKNDRLSVWRFDIYELYVTRSSIESLLHCAISKQSPFRQGSQWGSIYNTLRQALSEPSVSIPIAQAIERAYIRISNSRNQMKP